MSTEAHNTSIVPYGIDWSENAQPTSHCWFPYSNRGSSSRPSCAYTLCTVSESVRHNSFIQCGSCAISIHKDHITDCEQMINLYNFISSCRPSFTNDDASNSQIKFDQHHWSLVSSLSKPCMQCKRKLISKDVHRINERHVPNSMDHHNYKDSSPKKVNPLNCLICLWCLRGCHQLCWENINDNENDQRICDYGKYKNIIVRPQWIHRVANSDSRYYARFSRDTDPNDSSFTPLLIFINKRSGGQQGEMIYRQLIRLLNPRQVFFLENNADLNQSLDIYGSLANTRIYVCGGDGTVGWVLSALAERFSSMNNPPVSICPLGTGNDLSRVLGWGWHYQGKRLLNMILETSKAQPISLDRWQISLKPLGTTEHRNESRGYRQCCPCLLDHPKFVRETDPPSYQNYRTPPNVRFSNYLSFGLDAAVVLDFHDRRTRNPAGFTSPFKNKLLYLNTSRKYFKEFALWRSWDLTPYMRLICDGQDLTKSIRHCHTVVLLNIPSYGSGARPWGGTPRRSNIVSTTTFHDNNEVSSIKSEEFHTADSYQINNEICKPVTSSDTIGRFGEQRFGDRKIEVLGLDSIQMALIHLGLRGRRIAQCSEVRIELYRSMPIHMDGEPFYLAKSTTIDITHAGQVLVLNNQTK